MLERGRKNSCLRSSRSLVEKKEEVGGVVVEEEKEEVGGVVVEGLVVR